MELKRAGTGSWKGLCPFHAEKTPSFHVHEQRQFFHCFGCGEKGDVFTFLTKIEQRSFVEVLRDLAGSAGVELPEKQMSPAERKALAEAESERERMMRTMELATAFFEAQLQNPVGAAAREYLGKRGISDGIQKKFRVGYAPPGWDVMQNHLADKQIPPTVGERLGLVGVNERGRYDFFRDRVMLPVLDRQKRPVGYSSRLLDPEAKDRKYVNSPDSPLFHKKENLYGLHAALDAIRKAGLAIVVEGNFDVMSLHEAGIEEAVAPMGTALTGEQVAMLGKLARTVVLVFDGDEAGERASKKVIPIFVEADVDGRIARMPKDVDPDDFVRKEGADAFRKLVANARPVVDQFIDDLSREARDATVPERIHVLEKAAPVIAGIRNPTMRQLYAGRLAKMLEVSPNDVARALRSVSGPSRPVVTASAAPPPPRREPPRQEIEAFVLLVTHPELGPLTEAEDISALLTDPGMNQIYRIALEALRRGERPDVPAWLDAAPADIREALGAAVMDGRYNAADGAERGLRALLARLRLSRVSDEIERVKRERQAAMEAGDQARVREIDKTHFELIRTQQGLSNALARP